MVDQDVKKRLSLEEIKSHEWYKGPTPTIEDISSTFKFRFKIYQSQNHIQNLGASESNIFGDIQIPNDEELQKKISSFKKKGLKLRKYSEFFQYPSTEVLMKTIKKFANIHDMSFESDSEYDSPIHLETADEESKVVMNVNIIKHPNEDIRRIE
jgi:hypothetical protein